MSNHNFKDLTGKTFGYWTVIYRVENNKHGNAMWHVKCKCNVLSVVAGGDLLSGASKSCGCFRLEVSKKKFVTHSLSKSSTYLKCENMTIRC